MRRLWKKIPRWLRFALDALLALALLTAVYVALGCPFLGETALFRLAEKANLAGPSEIIDRLRVQAAWPILGCDEILIGDDGEEILFWFYRYSSKSGTLLRREKSDGLLLLPLPFCAGVDSVLWQRDVQVPLFLFADEPEAVKATVRIRLSETDELTLTQTRGENVRTWPGDPGSREGYFLFSIPVAEEEWALDRGVSVRELLHGYEDKRFRPAGCPVTIRLYDGEDRLLETREWTL